MKKDNGGNPFKVPFPAEWHDQRERDNKRG